MYRAVFFRIAMLGVAIAIAGCNPRVDTPQLGAYRAVLRLPGGDTPFGFEVAQEQQRYVIYLTNGTERTRVSNVQVAAGELTAVFPGYENSLRATLHRDSIEGSVTLIKAGGKEQVIPFNAKLGETYRFYADAATDNADVDGTWEATFTNDKGETSKALLLFDQQHDHVSGSVMTPTGDHRFLEGQMRGDELQLSTFAGGLAYLYKLKVDAKGGLEGEYWQGLAAHEKVAARRNDAATLDGAGKQTAMRDSEQPLNFTFPDADGKPVSLSDPQFRGKVVLVTLGGTWCPNCHDEANFLAPFYRENRHRGFEVVALMFERHGDFAKAARAVRGYRQDLGIDYPTLIAGLSETDEASKALPMLNGIYGYPTAILVDRGGRVRSIHTGFAGPATGRHYDEHVKEFRDEVEQLLAVAPAG
ncbi:MAG TPA: TlpA disulfide reductase family protein [Steroidobacteraceae bacterium]|nr:TlpA disulfide reductase family protein [Steroidobacteraceae bacterium]